MSMWEIIARARGWQEARDSETDELVVFHEGKAHHYVGPAAWREAALHTNCPHCKE